MAEGGGGPCPCNGAKKKSGVFKMFRLKKKKKTDCNEPCIKCLQKNINFTTSQYSMDAEKERMMMAEAKRKEPNYIHEAQWKEPNYIYEAHQRNVHLPPDRMAQYPDDDIIEDPSAMSPHNTERRLVSASSSSRELAGAMGMPPNEAAMVGVPLKYHPQNCVCVPCKQKRYDDSLLAMDAQVILQNSLLQNTITDTAGLVCTIL